jgi:uncharacterized protein YjdB
VAGWYHDAGDWDGYFSHQRIPVILMLTYEAVPERFMDGDLNIPESGNGIPDIIDEASWLIKFNYRLRKELQAKGFSDGGVGGARVAPDFFTAVDGNAESNKPSWKDHRRYVVSNADAYMTYLYAGQAAQLAFILKSLGKNPEAFPVEMLDHVDFDQMTYDDVNWITEAKEAYAWATHPDNQPSKHAHYSSPLWVYKMYAATSLYRLTGEEMYHDAAKEQLTKVKNKPHLDEDERYAAYMYLLTNNVDVDKGLKESLKTTAIGTAGWRGMNAARIRGLRWGGVFDMPMLVGQGTTPWMFETIFAYAITGDEKYADVVHTTADYFLGSNPLHTTWMTGVGPRPALGGFHLDSRYLWNKNWMVYKGFVPYGPWSMNYGFNPVTWVVDGVEIQGGAGPWNEHWANFSVHPKMEQWPGHERYNNNIHAPMSTENTVHQQSVFLASTYGFVNNRKNNNATAPVKMDTLELNKTEILFDAPGQQVLLTATPDIDNSSFPALKWYSSDARIAHVDGFGRVTGITGGTATITCGTLDGSVVAQCRVVCNWTDTEVVSITLSPESVTLFVGQTTGVTVTFDPAQATNQFVDWSYSQDGIVMVNEAGQLVALQPGIVTVTATSVKDAKTDAIQVEVKERVDHVIADFDNVIPVTDGPNPDFAQLYTPEGENDIAAPNPYNGLANESDLVFRWDRPQGDWRLFGIVLPTEDPQDLSQYAEFQFKYYGRGIKSFYIQLIPVEGSNIEITTPVDGEDCWKLFTLPLNTSVALKQFNVFVNPTGSPDENSFYFDDFVLAGNPAIPFSELLISHSAIELDSYQTFQLQANSQGTPFSWVSSDPRVATVDHSGLVTAVSGGTTTVKAVSLYGNTVVCVVTVDGGIAVAVESIEITGDQSYVLDLAETLLLTAIITPEDASNKNVIWSSSNDAVATVSSAGLVTAVVAGNATITAEAEENTEIKASVSITVLPTNIGELERNEVRIIPNPSQGHYTVEAPIVIHSIEIMDLTGKRIVMIQSEGAKRMEIVNDDPAPGIYFVRVMQTDGSIRVVKKVVSVH